MKRDDALIIGSFYLVVINRGDAIITQIILVPVDRIIRRL